MDQMNRTTHSFLCRSDCVCRLVLCVSLCTAIIYLFSHASSAWSCVNNSIQDARRDIVYFNPTPRHNAGGTIYFGGNAEDVSYSFPRFAAAFPDIAIYMMHYRGYGGSSGRPSESALHTDAKELFKMVQAKHPDVIVVGRSLGSGVAIRLASEEPVSRLVLITPFDSILNIAKRAAPFLPIGLLMQDRYESWRVAPLVRSPTLIIAADNDEIIPASNTAALFRAFSRESLRYKRWKARITTQYHKSQSLWRQSKPGNA